MTESEIEILKSRVKQLETEVADREKDLGLFRSELSKANQKLETLIDRINNELKVAQQIHKTLLPTDLPHIPGFEFSTKFVPSTIKGGDYFDIFEHEDRTRFGLIIASSSGHTMSALLLSILLKLTGQMEARKGAEPHNVMKEIARELVPHVQGEETADVFYGMFDRKNFELSYCQIGDISAFYQDSGNGGELVPLTSCASSFGKGFKENLESKTISLSPRDRLVFCTHGVIEAQDLNGEPFGSDRLIQSIMEAPSRGVHELRNEILYRVENYLSGQEPQRDMTVVISEVKDRIIKLAKS